MAKRQSFSSEQRARIWAMWRTGHSLSDIARELGRKPGTIYGVLSERGGIAPRDSQPASQALSLAEREEISRGLAAGRSLRQIADALSRAASTISREVQRNGRRRSYRALAADLAARQRRKRPKALKLESEGRLRHLVAEKLNEDWSPEQVAGWLRRTYPDSADLHVSHECIYRALYLFRRSGLDPRLRLRLRTRRRMRRARTATTAGQKRGQIVDAVPISQRPAVVETRVEVGHWEGDLIAGAANSHLATLVERSSRFTILVPVQAKDARTVADALIPVLLTLPARLRRSLTWDRGTELARHADITAATGTAVYFCDPKSPWQRGTNENTNRLLRQYFPKATRLGDLSKTDLDTASQRLNRRPRKTLSFATPAHILDAAVALTV